MGWEKHRLFLEVYGRPPHEVGAALSKTGIEFSLACRLVGIADSCMRKHLRRYHPDLRWPTPKARLKNLEKGRQLHAKQVLYKGKVRNLAEIARMEKLDYSTVLQRHRRYGLNGEQLGKPRRHDGRRREFYKVGLSVREWEVVLEYANERGDEAARLKFGVPVGAISAYRRGELHRVA